MSVTKSTGAREKQRRREELFSAEMLLYRVLLHLRSSFYWARWCCPSRENMPTALLEYQGIDEAFDIVRLRLRRVRAEQKRSR